MSVKTLSNNRCTILSPVIARDAFGAVVHTWTIFLDNVPCRIRHLSGREMVQSGKTMEIPDHRIYLSQPLTITDDMSIVEKATGNSYDIICVNEFYYEHLQIDARMVTPIINYAAPTTQTWNVVYNGVQITYNTSPVVYTQVL